MRSEGFSRRVAGPEGYVSLALGARDKLTFAADTPLCRGVAHRRESRVALIRRLRKLRRIVASLAY